ncbi:flavodoxin family protein [[Clostridium] hylemonae]|uniref:flavodoxin family protein n=1 Tax=[Clostridium] hylemonae TaxID=89153 RepID=UPI001FCA6A70|nr:flavodoxin family protein [[Clostridium] hylemonae]BDF05750.1 FMN reductase [[Clostridium] hylemonae]
MKKVLLLSASPRKGGNSDILCDEFMRGAVEAGNKAEKIFLREKNINYCTGCGTCSFLGKPCPQKDDMAKILDKLIEADVIVMATPVYFYTMDAQMKTLIDRCCSRYTEMKEKEFYFIVTAAVDSIAQMERTVEGLRGFTVCLDSSRERGVIYGAGVWQAGEIKDKPAMQEAYDAGRNV